VIDLATGRETDAFRGHDGCVLALDLSADGRVLVSGGADRSARVWDTATGRVTAVYRGHAGGVDHIRLARSGRWAVSAEDDGPPAHLWDVSNGNWFANTAQHAGGVSALDVDPVAGLVLTVSDKDQSVRVWDGPGGRLGQGFDGHPAAADAKGAGQHHYDARVLAGGRVLATAGADATLRCWRLATGQEVGQVRLTGRVVLLAAARDAPVVAAVASEGKTVRLSLVRLSAN
jgi:WD40 repeat protein